MSPDRPTAGSAEPRIPLSEAELGALVAAARGRGATAVRNRALVALLAGSGAKPGEALRLRPDDVDLERGTLVLRSRAGVAREGRLLPAARPHVEAWQLVRERLGLQAAPSPGEDLAPLFCTRAGGALEPSYLRRLLPRLARVAGLERAVNAGLLRATFAAHVYRLGAPLPAVQRLLGHGDARSTLHLVRPVLDEDASEPEAEGFRPDRWALPGAAGDLRVELVVREPRERSVAPPAATTPAGASRLEPADEDGRMVVTPARWREL